MNNQTTLEVIAPTIDEAVSKGLSELGLTLDDVDIEILDEGSKGLFGIGNRQALVRLTVKEEMDRPPRIVPPSKEDWAKPTKEREEPQGQESREAPQAQAVAETAGDQDPDEVLTTAREIVTELLEKMSIRAQVVARYGEADSPNHQPPVIVDVQGKDLSILIGRKAATLNALQYIARLIIGKELERSVMLVVDVEGYRARRERQLRRLALQMADQAIQTGRRQILEPMPANERRIVHITLRENTSVSTESIGEEPRRKVTIIPIP
jgi:spoIIIJ-associated protein